MISKVSPPSSTLTMTASTTWLTIWTHLFPSSTGCSRRYSTHCVENLLACHGPTISSSCAFRATAPEHGTTSMRHPRGGASEPSAGTSPPSTTTGSPGTRRWMTTAGTHLNRMQRVRPRDSPSSRTRSSLSSSTTCRASCSNSEGGSRSWPGRSTSGPRPKTSTSTWCSTTSTPGASCS